MEFQCFICGIGFQDETPSNYKAQHDLKRMIYVLCKIIPISSIQVEDWEFSGNLSNTINTSQDICCTDCFAVLVQLEKLHFLIQRVLDSLKKQLHKIQTRIVESESQNVVNPSWSVACQKFRMHVLNHAAREKTIDDNINAFIKREVIDPEISVEDLNGDNCGRIDACYSLCDPNTAKNGSTTEGVLNTDNLTIREKFASLTTFKDILQTHATDQNASSIQEKDTNPTQRPFQEPKPRTRGSKKKVVSDNLVQLSPSTKKKRKTETIVSSEKQSQPNSTRTRILRRSAQLAIHKIENQEKNEENDEDFDPSENNEKDIDYNVSDDDIQSELSVASKPTPKSKQTRKIRKASLQAARARVRPPKPQYLPFVIAKENLYIVRWGTFVSQTLTNLICHAHGCNFKAKWNHFNYYESFQVMKDHILEDHRDRKHRQKTIHPCLLCDKVFPNQELFRKHFPEHKEFRSKTAEAVCECCLRSCQLTYIRTHMFSHKNAEEQEAGKAARDCSYRNLLPKESEISEKKFTCTYKKCNAAFKSTGNLKRHLQTHLPHELRTDRTTCEECGANILKESLKDHMERVHHPERVQRFLRCPICFKKFHPSHGAVLKGHIRRHNNERPYMCTQCGGTFVSAQGLNCHIYQVHSDRPLPCEHCDMVYTKMSTFKRHQQTKHPDKCPSPMKQRRKTSKFYYGEEEARMESLAVFGPVQQFPCPKCDIICKYRFTLKKHLQRHETSSSPVLESESKEGEDVNVASLQTPCAASSINTLSQEEMASPEIDIGISEEALNIDNDSSSIHETIFNALYNNELVVGDDSQTVAKMYPTFTY